MRREESTHDPNSGEIVTLRSSQTLEMYASVQCCPIVHEPIVREFDLRDETITTNLSALVDGVNRTQNRRSPSLANIVDVTGPSHPCSQPSASSFDVVNTINECGGIVSQLTEIVEVNDEEQQDLNISESIQDDSTYDTDSTDDEEDVNVELAPSTVSNIHPDTMLIPYLDHTDDVIDDSSITESSSDDPLWNEKKPEYIKSGTIVDWEHQSITL